MRKNRMMRAASALMVAVLLTTSTISGTFAKYVTQVDGGDVARVAKWGVEVGFSGSLFEDSYIHAPDTSADKTVSTSVATENVVAPGTKNDGGLTFRLTGTPEVETKVEVKVGTVNNAGEFVDGAPIDVFLPAGTYVDYTEAVDEDADGVKGYEGKFTLADPYHPIKFTVKNGAGNVIAGDLTLAQLETFFEGLSGQYDPNTNLATQLTNLGTGTLDGTFVISWIWDFDAAGAGTNDKADTYLGQLAAGKAAAAGSTGVNIAIQIVVTQVD